MFENIVDNQWIPMGYLSNRYPNVRGRILLELKVIKVEQGSPTLLGHTYRIY